MSAINSFLVQNDLRIATNPCVSPDFCLDWPAFADRPCKRSCMRAWSKSGFETSDGVWTLVEHVQSGDCAWVLAAREGVNGGEVLDEVAGMADGSFAFPATFENLLRLKNLILEHDPDSTIFPTSRPKAWPEHPRDRRAFHHFHWPAVEWAMMRSRSA